MKLLIKQRFFSLTDTFDVFDEMENPKYFIKAEFFSFCHNISIYDKATERRLGGIKEKIFNFMPKFDLEIGGRFIGTIRKEFTFFKPKYHIDIDNWNVEGDFMSWDYDVKKGNDLEMSISKEIFNFTDTYVINILKPENELLGLLIVLTIDAANRSKG